MNRNFRAFFVVLLLVALSAIHLTLNNQNINRDYQFVALEKKLNTLRNENRFLSYKAAKKRSLDRIENIAVTKLNMVYPKDLKYLQVKGSTSESF